MSLSLLVLAASIVAAPTPSPESTSAPLTAPTEGVAPQAAAPVQSAPPASAAVPMNAAPPEKKESTASSSDGIVVTGRGKPPPTDPLQELNAKSFEVIQDVDKAVVGPVTMTYAKHVPSPIRAGVHNVLSLLEEPTVFANFLLQHRVGKAAETLVRVAVNASMGFGGLIDVAKRPGISLPHRNNGFADTMGFYGVKQGPYLFLPLIGSTTVRDLAGRMLDLSLLSATVGGLFSSSYYGPVRGTMASIDDRVEFDAKLHQLRDETPDGYSSVRQYYLDERAAEIEGLHRKKATRRAPTTQLLSPPLKTPPIATD